ncbi:hypothetical protein PUN28_015702 [Cardiocondyla obscurior]|uniref:Uncharacterized protein n=1 Tax=Cardiocondyla obscurior TaxID=286306 RepID=A0AAW2EXW9_9HYME
MHNTISNSYSKLIGIGIDYSKEKINKRRGLRKKKKKKIKKKTSQKPRLHRSLSIRVSIHKARIWQIVVTISLLIKILYGKTLTRRARASYFLRLINSSTSGRRHSRHEEEKRDVCQPRARIYARARKRSRVRALPRA